VSSFHFRCFPLFLFCFLAEITLILTFGYPTFGASSSRRSVNDDLRELIRAASRCRAPPAVPRSQSHSVAMARIDEDRLCEFRVAWVVLEPELHRQGWTAG
jgi:hypothetical protein